MSLRRRASVWCYHMIVMWPLSSRAQGTVSRACEGFNRVDFACPMPFPHYSSPYARFICSIWFGRSCSTAWTSLILLAFPMPFWSGFLITLLVVLFSVCVGSHSSEFHLLLCGVPQGSILSPRLYSLYVAPISFIIESYDLLYHVYADDSYI